MPGLPVALEVSPVHPLPMRKADAAPLGLVSLIKPSVPTERAVDAGTLEIDSRPGLGTVVRGLGLETPSGRRPLAR